ncbi:hypothetical protein CC86DRAFT_10798 [Ophiobolus disseminans]|uniref:Uncharacterized protein n=1 Tax=Ophiobolus disseminans TaxID=1469910 RepID=A0A6A7AK50_9PLEO|nr:hypothetical protein CC86DRAFT_10798 [Ophiobolus disseminans]
MTGTSLEDHLKRPVTVNMRSSRIWLSFGSRNIGCQHQTRPNLCTESIQEAEDEHGFGL